MRGTCLRVEEVDELSLHCSHGDKIPQGRGMRRRGTCLRVEEVDS